MKPILLLAIVLPLSCTSPQWDGEWRRDRRSSRETYYPGIDFGMTFREVQAKVPPTYKRSGQTPNRLTYEKRGATGGRVIIRFTFADGLLVSTDEVQQ